MTTARELVSRVQRTTPDKNETFSQSGTKDFVPETPPEIVDVGGKNPLTRYRPQSNLNNSYT